jgi:hypothetical protein
VNDTGVRIVLEDPEAVFAEFRQVGAAAEEVFRDEARRRCVSHRRSRRASRTRAASGRQRLDAFSSQKPTDSFEGLRRVVDDQNAQAFER